MLLVSQGSFTKSNKQSERRGRHRVTSMPGGKLQLTLVGVHTVWGSESLVFGVRNLKHGWTPPKKRKLPQTNYVLSRNVISTQKDMARRTNKNGNRVPFKGFSSQRVGCGERGLFCTTPIFCTRCPFPGKGPRQGSHHSSGAQKLGTLHNHVVQVSL